MAKYVYPAMFTREADGGYVVEFPDVENCFTDGATLEEALEMAEDALCLTLYDMEESGQSIPTASVPGDIKLQDGQIASLVRCDTSEYRRFYDNRSIKKTLTIPNWLNTIAERSGVNFSVVLQNALRRELGV